jgi:acylphosphatase
MERGVTRLWRAEVGQGRSRVMQAVHILASGRVQGVGYRAFVVHEAMMRGISGWVRNCGDGTVEAVFEANDKALADMLGACRRGPQFARVADIAQRTASDAEVAMRRNGELFSVLPTL